MHFFQVTAISSFRLKRMIFVEYCGQDEEILRKQERMTTGKLDLVNAMKKDRIEVAFSWQFGNNLMRI